MILIAVCTRQILWPKTRVPTVCSAIVMPVWVIVASSCHSRIERYTSQYQTLEPSSASYKYSRRDIRYHTEPFEAMHYLSLKNIFQLFCSSLLNQLGFVQSRSPLTTGGYTLNWGMEVLIFLFIIYHCLPFTEPCRVLEPGDVHLGQLASSL